MKAHAHTQAYAHAHAQAHAHAHAHAQAHAHAHAYAYAQAYAYAHALTWLVGLACVMSACASAPRVTDALDAWRHGQRDAAIALAKGEVDRFREGNAITLAEVDERLAAIDKWSVEETPILMPDKPTPKLDDDPNERPATSLDSGIRQDLASLGATRMLRATRVIERLVMQRFATDLFVVIWRREPFAADGPLLRDDNKAMRSVTVKAAALRALEALR